MGMVLNRCHDSNPRNDSMEVLSEQETEAQIFDDPVPRNTSDIISTESELLPLGAEPVSVNKKDLATPPNPLPTLPSNVTAARLLGYVLI